MHFSRRTFTRSREEGNRLNDLKSGTSVGRFPSGDAASTAVKGLQSCVFSVPRESKANMQTSRTAQRLTQCSADEKNDT